MALNIAISAKRVNGQKRIDAFLAEVDAVRNWGSVLAASDALAPQSGFRFQVMDVRFHSYLIQTRP